MVSVAAFVDAAQRPAVVDEHIARLLGATRLRALVDRRRDATGVGRQA